MLRVIVDYQLKSAIAISIHGLMTSAYYKEVGVERDMVISIC